MARRPCRAGYAQQLRAGIEGLCPPTRFDDLAVHGNTQWTPGRLLLTLVLMSWHDAKTLVSRFENVRELLSRMLQEWACPTSYTGYAEALTRWVGLLFPRVREILQAHLRRMARGNWTVSGWLVFGADGSRFESPRTKANEQGLKCAGKIRTAPQVYHTMLLHLGLNALWDFRIGPGTASERRHLEEMAGSLPAGSLIAADAGFVGYELCQRLKAANVSFLLRVGANLTVLVQELGTLIHREGNIVWLWPAKFRDQPPLVLRMILLGRGKKAVFLLTDVLESSRLSARQAREIYRRRWGIEVAYRTIKQTFDRREWLSRTPRTVLAEHTASLLGLWILQVLSLKSLRRCHHDPRQWSPSRTRDVTRRAMRLALDRSLWEPLTWRDQLGQAVRDQYRRRRSKRARSWPHQKHEPPTRPPGMTELTPKLRLQGQALLDGS
jgi:hypothetical protein